MFASKRSIRKAQGTGTERKVISHNNKSYRVGRRYYVQSVFDASGKVIKNIVHEMSAAPDAWRPSKKKRRLKKCFKNQPKS